MAFDFGILSAGLGVLNGINADKSARAQMREGERLTKKGLLTAEDAYHNLKKSLLDAKASGAYNAEQVLKLADERAQLNLENTIKNSSAQMALLGYKPGDSNVDRTLGKASRDSALAQREQAAQINQTYTDRAWNAENQIANAGFNVAGVQRGTGASLFDMGQVNSANSGLGDALGIASTYLNPPKDPTTDYTPTVKFSDEWARQHPVLAQYKAKK